MGNSEAAPDTVISMTLEIFIFANLALLFVGLIMGSIEIFYLSRAFSKSSLLKKLILKTLIYVILIFVFIIITYPIAASLESGENVFHPSVRQDFFKFFISQTMVSTIVQMIIQIGASLFYSEMSENIGHRVLFNLFTGKYHHPHEEKRIFMFIDMRSSTTLAEKLGHIEYFKLLKAFHADISESIIDTGGQIYQYAGDEVIVTWILQKDSYNRRWVECFFSMKQDLKQKSKRYQQQFGVVPEFKAGCHVGLVTTGEIGVLKKEIFFTGDVLNTTARIQGKCNELGVDLLASGELLQETTLPSYWHSESLGDHTLKGKLETVELFTIVNQQE